jgi:hypothetical protein
VRRNMGSGEWQEAYIDFFIHSLRWEGSLRDQTRVKERNTDSLLSDVAV